MIFLRDSLCLSADFLTPQWHDILDFSNCPLSGVLHVTLAIWQEFRFENRIVSYDSADGKIFCYDHLTSRVIRTLDAHSAPCMDVANHPTLPCCLTCQTVGGMDKLKCGHNKLGNLSNLDGYVEDKYVLKENIFHFWISRLIMWVKAS